MNINQLSKFWNTLQTRERFLVTILLSVLVIFLFTSYFFNVFNSIALQNRVLENSKNDFSYVYDKASNFQIYIKAQNAIKQTLSIDEYLVSEANLNNLSNFQIIEENGRKILNFSNSSIKNITRFLEIVIAHPSIIIEIIDVTPVQETYRVKVAVLNI